jgi:hypothetical protein
MYALAFVLALGASTVAVVLVVQNDWSTTRWQAVAAIATCVQAIAVIVAAILALKQIRANGRIAHRARLQALADRLELLAFDAAGPALDRALDAAGRTGSASDSYADPDSFIRRLKDGSDVPTDARRKAIREWSEHRFTAGVEDMSQATAEVKAATGKMAVLLRVMDDQDLSGSVSRFGDVVGVFLHAFASDLGSIETETLRSRADRVRDDWKKLRERIIARLAEVSAAE